MKIPIYSDDDRDETAGAKASESEVGQAGEGLPPSGAAPSTASTGEVADIRVQELEAALMKMTQEHEGTRAQLLRLMADFDNYRKRMTRQFEEGKQYATTDLVHALLPGLDNLERALAAAQQDAHPTSATIAAGVSMVLKQLTDALAKAGVRPLQVQGEVFDPIRHEAVEVVPVPPPEDGLIVQEVQRGYMMHDRLLRPAKVVVGKSTQGTGHGGA
jgi:molecular chaperone GrpE